MAHTSGSAEISTFAPEPEKYSSIHQELVEKYETPFPLISTCFSTQQKIKTLFMFMGMAQIGEEEISVEFIDDYGYNYDQRHIFLTDLLLELKKLGFTAEVHDDGTYQRTDPTEEEHPNIFFHYANKPEYLAEKASSNLLDQFSQGMLYGYPETAVRAATENLILQKENLPPDLLKNPLWQYIFFLPSQNNYRQEWQWFIDNLKMALQEYPEIVKDLGLKDIVRKGVGKKHFSLKKVGKKLRGER